MEQSTPSGGIFISYRRSDTAQVAGRLSDRLRDRFGSKRIFVDVDLSAVGLDFARAITDAVSVCDLVIALIGKNWLTATDDQGRRHLDDEHDTVRVEIVAAFQGDVKVVPILVDGAGMPSADELPAVLRPLMQRQAEKLDSGYFDHDLSRLMEKIEPLLPWSEPEDRRLIAGAVISWTWHPAGVILPIREGTNVINMPEDKYMSRDHALIICGFNADGLQTKPWYEIVDNESSNGTFLYGQMMVANERTALQNYAEIKTGQTVWTFVMLDPPYNAFQRRQVTPM
jgi:hypothetical protein